MERSIFPEMFQIIVFAHVGQEDVNQHVAVVHGDPLRVLQSYHMDWLLMQALTGKVADRLRDGLDL